MLGLYHFSSDSNLLKILTEKRIKNSQLTKNTYLLDIPSPYIYFRLGKEQCEIPSLKFDTSILLDHKFFYHPEWCDGWVDDVYFEKRNSDIDFFNSPDGKVYFTKEKKELESILFSLFDGKEEVLNNEIVVFDDITFEVSSQKIRPIFASSISFEEDNILEIPLGLKRLSKIEGKILKNFPLCKKYYYREKMCFEKDNTRKWWVGEF